MALFRSVPRVITKSAPVRWYLKMLTFIFPCQFIVICSFAVVFAEVKVTRCSRPPHIRQDAPFFARSPIQPTYAAVVEPVLVLRGGVEGPTNTEEESDEPPPLYRSSSWNGSRDFVQQPHSGGHNKQESTASRERIEKIAENLKSKRDDIAADVRARGEAIAADLKAKQEKITDEVLRDRSPEAFGELGGHHSYDSATAGLDVANRRSFFLGIRRVILFVQVVELIAACIWQALFPYGGVAGFISTGGESLTTPQGALDATERIGQGRLGFAISAALVQGALYTIIFVFFGCDRAVLRAIRLTGWEHGAAAAWAAVRAVRVAGGGGKISNIAVSLWLGFVAVLCIYFGRQL